MNKNFALGVMLGFMTPIILLGILMLSYNKEIEEPIHDLAFLEIIQTDGSLLAIDSINNKGLLINFWATWCAPCIKEMPLFHKIENDGQIKVIALSNQKIDIIKKFTQENKYSFLIAQYRMTDGGLINVLPTTILINQNQEVVWSKSGSVTEMELNRAIRMLNKQ